MKLLPCLVLAALCVAVLAEPPEALRANSEDVCVATCAPEGATYACDEAAQQTYENACYAHCYGAANAVPGPCAPLGVKLSSKADKFLKADRSGAPDILIAAGNDSAAPVAPAAAEAAAAAAAAGIAGEGVAAASPLVAPGTHQSARKTDRAGLRKGAKAAAAAAATAGITPAANSYTKLYVKRSCAETADVWFAASWLPYGSSTWKTDGWWQLPTNGGSVYFANTRNRYFYIYAYAQQCYRGKCCSKIYWSGRSTLALRGVNYPFAQWDFGSTLWTTYTATLTCNCRTMFCLTSPCCKCS